MGDEKTPTLTVALGGTYVKLKIPGSPPPKTNGSKRGQVRGFSRQARGRLLDFLASINRDVLEHIPLFVTLTYPEHWPGDAARWKRDLYTLFKRWERKYDNVSCVWKLEYQKRGAPHYHILVFGVQRIPHADLAEDWYSIVGSGDSKHLHAGTQVKSVTGWDEVTSYASKYLGKVDGEWVTDANGRYWGVWHRDRIPRQMVVLSVDWRAAMRLRRVMYLWSTKQDVPIGRPGKHTGIKRYLSQDTSTKLLLYADSLGGVVEDKSTKAGGKICTENKPKPPADGLAAQDFRKEMSNWKPTNQDPPITL